MIVKKQIIKINQNPFDLFDNWFQKAKRKEINDHNAMNLATVNKRLQPSSRIVLLKSYDKKGFVFYTNINSNKGKNIKNNSKVALNFYWKSLFLQVRIEGIAQIVSSEESDNYFNSRIKESRIGAWASKQSSLLKNRKILEKRFQGYTTMFKNNNIPRPSYWIGIRVKPKLFEFWKKMPHRLHDRVQFIKASKRWKSKRLYP